MGIYSLNKACVLAACCLGSFALNAAGAATDLEQVTVTAQEPLIDTEKTEQSQNVSQTMVSNLPVVSRLWEQFALLTPGVNPDGTSGGMSFHGINNLYSNNSVDGANNNNNYDGGSRGSGSSDGAFAIAARSGSLKGAGP